jgi:hypothetical protein
MPSHYWGDEDFDWESLYAAEREAVDIMQKFGRIGVRSKEKYGTIRWSIFLCDNRLHSFTHPGYMGSRYPKWLWKIDIMHPLLTPVGWAIRAWQKQVVQFAFKYVCNKYPHIVDEILQDAPAELLPENLALITKRQWSRQCKSCDEWNTTDLVTCKKCGAKI